MKRFLIFALLALTLSCKQSAKDDFSSPVGLFVDLVSSYTGGVVSVASPIKLRLAKNAGDSLAGTTITKTIFNFSPAVAGTTFWEDNRTIIFKPAESLKSDQEYAVTANLNELLPDDATGETKEFKFIFRTLVQNYDLQIDGLKLYQRSDLTRMKVQGQLQTADVAPAEKIKQILKASQAGKALDITWADTGVDNIYTFVVENVVRGEKAGEVSLTTNGGSIGVEKKSDVKVDVPALSDYKVLSARVVRGKENYISVLFSDPLDERQNMNGLISLTNVSSKPRLVIDLNELKIYPTQDIASDTELAIYKAIKNTAGFSLKEDFTTTLQFAQANPEVRLVNADDKTILPNSKGLKLAFEAVGLKAVDVTVVRIFPDNMLQYLQVNELGGDNELRRVGHPIARKTIPLTTSGVTDLNKWNQFSLNLEDIIKSEPGVAYQVKIGFRKVNSLYFCSEDTAIESLSDDDEWGAEEESSYWDDSEYYYEDYNWEERDNPCSDSYYGDRRSAHTMVLASDLGIIAKKRDGGDLYVFISNLITTDLMNGVEVEAYDFQQQSIGKGSTDKNGEVQLKVSGNPFALIARKGEQVGYLKLDNGSALSLSNFDISGTEIKNGLKAFIYGERGVWRPADTVHLGFIIEDVEDLLPDRHPVVMELFDPMNQLAFKKVNANAVGDMYRFDFVTDADAPTGNWLAKAKVGGATFTKTVKIETIKPNRLKVDLKFDKEKFSANDRSVSGNLNVRWLSGATASNLKVEYELLLSPVKTVFSNYPNFTFDDNSKDYTPERTLVYEGHVNSEGNAHVEMDLGSPDNAPGAMTARLFGKVYEEGGDFSISNTSIPYFPYSSFVGLKTPEGDKRGMLLTDEDHEIKIASVDADGKPVSRNGVKVALYKVDWRWWWDNSYDNLSNYVGQSYRQPIATSTINTSNGEGKWTLRVNQPEWGRYYIRVEDPISGHSAGKTIYLDWPGWAGKAKRGELDGATMLDFGVEKEEYKVGENIALSIPTTEGNKILVSLESGSEILQTFWVDAKEGNTAVSFEATPDMAPNVYVHLTMIQPHAQDKNDLPIRLFGIHSVKVVDAGTVLRPVIKMPKELTPEQQFTVEVSESQKKPMAYTIAIVDEGLLDITNFKTPDPWASFYAREALGIKTWDVYDDVMGAFSGQLDHLISIGGDGDLQPKDATETNRFKPVVKYLGPFYLKAGETGKHTIKMPQYIGSVKTMVVAAGSGAYGSAEAVTPVKQPLMILATLPRVAGPGETMKLPVNVFALEENVGNVSVSVEVSGAMTLAGNKTVSTTFAKSGDKVIYFDLKAMNALGKAKVKVTAKSAKLTANYDIDMEIIPRNPMTTDISDKVLAPNETWELAYDPLGTLGKNSGVVELSSLPPLNVEQRLKYLIQYPHGCIEQTTSAIFSQLYINKLITLTSDKQAEIQRNVDAGIKRLRTFQLSNGGFSYWPGEAYASNWGSNYAGHFLVEAQKAGYAIPDGIISSWVSFQTQKADAWGPLSTNEDDDLVQAYRLYTLAVAGSPALGAMNRMKENQNLKRESKWRLASAYALAGYASQATSLVDNLSTTAEPAPETYRYTFGSQTRDQAMILETLLDLNQKEKAFEILMGVAREMGEKDRWMSTQTTAYCFIAIAKYAGSFGVDAKTNVSVDLSGKVTQVASGDFVNQVPVSDPDKKAQVKMINKGTAPVFARLIRTGIPLEGTEQPGSRNINFGVDYLDMQDNPIDAASIKQGTNFKARVTINNPGERGTYTEIALTQLFPSGWEIINTRLDESETENKDAKYIDIRDDRVMHYFDLAPTKSVQFTVLLNASYQGRFYLPSVTVGAMYDNSIFGNKQGRWVTVVAQ